MENQKELIDYLKNQIEEISEEDMNNASWGYEEGILLTGNQAKKIIELLESEPQEQKPVLTDEEIDKWVNDSFVLANLFSKAPKELLLLLRSLYADGAKAYRDGKISGQEIK